MIRDAIYELFARNRYRWFGRRDACILPNSDRCGHRGPPRNGGTMAPGAGRHDEGSSVTAIQLSPRRRRAHLATTISRTWAI
nr:hypothetical protein G6P99_04515 [Bradyrhizobium sp. 6(2017)]